MSLTIAESAEVVRDLRRARRKQRVAAIHWVDALYQVYITGLVAVVAVVLISGAVGDEKLSHASVLDVRDHGPAVVGLVLAIAVLAGLRSGAHGGPLALEQPDVRHVLLAPVDRGVALRGPAWRQLRFLVAASAAVGATAGQLALRRLPGNPAEWMAVGALFAIATVATGFGCALVASGTGLRPWLATLVGGALVAWSVGDITGDLPTAPASVGARLALWPLRTDPLGLLVVAVAAVPVVVGMRLVAHTSLEAAERRTSLVGQMRFAVTLQDLRTVLVLRRQLAQERSRHRPWIPALTRRPRFPVWYRGVRSVARWPLGRVVRVLSLALIAGLALRGVWTGTTPLIALAGLALWIAALDAAESMGQEIDHPGRTDTFPMPRGLLLLHHLPIVLVVSAATGLLAGGAAVVPVGSHVPADVGLLVGAVAGLLAGCGAVVSVVQGAPEAVDTLAIMTPEIAGTRTVFRTAYPPALGIAGITPLLAARAAARGAGDPPPVQAALIVTLLLMIVVVLVAGWVRFRDDIQKAMATAGEALSPTKAMEKVAAEREAAEAREAEALAESKRLADEARAAGGGAKPKGQPKPKPKPQASPAPEGVRGGTSAKPIGRKRDQK